MSGNGRESKSMRTDKEKKERKEPKESKRGREEATSSLRRSASPPPSAPPYDISQQLANMQNALIQNQQGSEERSRLHLVGLEQRISAKVERVESSLVQVQGEVKELSGVVSAHSQDLELVFKRIEQLELTQAELQKRLAIAESVEPVVSKTNQSFDRKPNTSIIKINAKTNVAKEAVGQALASIVANLGMERDCFVLKGDSVSRWFTAYLKGTPEIATRNARSILDAQRTEDGGWERVLVTNPASGIVQIYLGPDKSAKQIKTEVLTKALKRVLQGLGFSQVDTRPFKGEALIDWRPVAMLDVKSKDDVDILWDAEYRDTLKIDKGRVKELLFAGSPSRSPPVRWSS